MSKRYVYKASCYFVYDWGTQRILRGNSNSKNPLAYIANKTENMWTNSQKFEKLSLHYSPTRIEIPYCLLRNEDD